MGSLWLPDLDHWLRDAGLPAGEWPGWLTNSRSSGGYDDIFAIGVHHDASSASSTLAANSRYGFDTAQYAPIGAVRLNRGDGDWMVGAAGATNTQGKGGPLPCSRGTIPKDSGNRYVVSIEALNNGTGEPWSAVQQASYVRGVAAMIVGLRDQGAYNAASGFYRRISLNPLSYDVHAHFEWAPTRKIDPAGPSKWANLADRYLRWKMDLFRQDVAVQVIDIDGGGTPPPPGGGQPVKITELDLPAEAERMYDSRPDQPVYHNPNVAKGPLRRNETRKIGVAMAKACQVRITVVDAPTDGYLIVDGQPGGEVPAVNYTAGPGYREAEIWLQAVPDGHIYVSSPWTDGQGCQFVVNSFGTGN